MKVLLLSLGWKQGSVGSACSRRKPRGDGEVNSWGNDGSQATPSALGGDLARLLCVPSIKMVPARCDVLPRHPGGKMNGSAQMSLAALQHEAECGAWRAGTQAGSPPRDSPSAVASGLKGDMAVEMLPALLSPVRPSHVQLFTRHMCACGSVSVSVEAWWAWRPANVYYMGRNICFLCRTSTVSDVLLQGTIFFNKTKMRHGN